MHAFSYLSPLKHDFGIVDVPMFRSFVTRYPGFTGDLLCRVISCKVYLVCAYLFAGIFIVEYTQVSTIHDSMNCKTFMFMERLRSRLLFFNLLHQPMHFSLFMLRNF